MKVDDWFEKLEKEGYQDLRIEQLPPDTDQEEHGHDQDQVDVILSGELTIYEADKKKIFRPGDRLDVPAGTMHLAKGSPEGGEMIVGIKDPVSSIQ